LNKENTKKLFDTFPLLFKLVDSDVRPAWAITLFGIECQDGWFGIIWELCERIEPMIAAMPEEKQNDFVVHQIKEKFGGLRFYQAKVPTEEMKRAIDEAQSKCERTCEVCSEPGECVAINHWWQTLCSKHQEERRTRTGAFDYLACWDEPV
jgi:hypothetical protein